MAYIDISEKHVKFKNTYHSMRVPFVIYADFESFSIKINTCEPNPNESCMQKIMKHVPSSFCFYLVSTATDNHFEPITYTAQGDEDIGEIFSKKLIEYARMICDKYEKHLKPMQITDEKRAACDNVTHCNICDQLLIRREICGNDMDYAGFETTGMNPFRDHCHISGKYRCAAQSLRNLQH
jgi:hypothetical protein